MKCLNEPTPGVVWINCMDLTVPFLMVYLIGQLFKRTKKKNWKEKEEKRHVEGATQPAWKKFPQHACSSFVSFSLTNIKKEPAGFLKRVFLDKTGESITLRGSQRGFFRAQPPAILHFVLADVFLISLNLCKVVVLKLIISTIRKLCYQEIRS